MSKAARQTRRRKRQAPEKGPTLKVSDYFRYRLSLIPGDPTPPSWEDYLRHARMAHTPPQSGPKTLQPTPHPCGAEGPGEHQ